MGIDFGLRSFGVLSAFGDSAFGIRFAWNDFPAALSKLPMPTAKNRGSFSEFIRSWRYFIVALALCLGVALFYLEEDWRGHWSWQRYKRQMAARGERLDASAFVPPRVPDDKNFAMTPFLAPLFDFIPGSQKWAGSNPGQRLSGFAPLYDAAARALKTSNGNNSSNSWIKARTDLSTWYSAFLQADTNGLLQKPLLKTNLSKQEAARGVLTALSECDSVLDELQGASRLPYSRFNLRYEQDNPAEILLPHLAIVKKLCQVLQLRASARLAPGQTEAAFNDLKLMFFLIDASRTEPFLISHLVRMAEFYLALAPLTEGFGQWSDPQLREIEDILAHIDFCADAKRNLAAERAWGSVIIDYVARSGNKFNRLGNITGQQETDFAGVLMAASPEGWFALEKVNYCDAFERCVIPTIDLANRRISPFSVAKATEEVTARNGGSWTVAYLRHRFFNKLLLPAIGSFCRKTAFAQTAVDTATLACALERYRLARGQYPATLEALVPQFAPSVPHDIVTGTPLKYRLVGEDHYLLYSVGWNEVDDGGVISLSTKGEDIAASEGDWVWQLP